MKSYLLLSFILGIFVINAEANELDIRASFVISSFFELPDSSSASNDTYLATDKVRGRVEHMGNLWSVSFSSRESKFSRDMTRSNLLPLPDGVMSFRKTKKGYEFDSSNLNAKNVKSALFPLNVVRYAKRNKIKDGVFSYLYHLDNHKLNYKDVPVGLITKGVVMAKVGESGNMYYYRENGVPSIVLVSVNYKIPKDQLDSLFSIAKEKAFSDDNKLEKISKLLSKKYFYLAICEISWSD